MRTIFTINITIEIVCLVFSAALLAGLSISRAYRSRLGQILLWLLVISCVYNLADAVAWGFATRGEPWVRPLLVAANFVVYLTGYAYLVMTSIYIHRYIAGADGSLPRRAGYCIAALSAVLLALLLVSQVTGLVYAIDQDNYYRLGPLYTFTQVCTLAIVAINTGLVVRNRKRLPALDTRILLCFLIAPLVGSIGEMFIYEIMIPPVLMVASLVVLYVSIQVRQEVRAVAREAELTTSLMLSQIQPHFLYNVLASIEYLCDQDAKQAGATVREFSKYLRGNLDALSLKQPIPFAKELEHVRMYLSLEKQRFGQRLQVRFDIQAADFFLPALSLQPIVENAVRHGVTKRDEGGCIAIAAREVQDGFCVTVTDDGVGFAPREPAADNRTHLGIDNVRSRLKNMCGGTLAIDSTPGDGTVATIFIPKGGQGL